ncbi:MAG: RHS repeat-associated core domain-containing protein, partial [Kiritimatiellae bacterium]|nr:RHS repeat-associated core domain-containing protein [Kiritimatiellia bacterium]
RTLDADGFIASVSNTVAASRYDRDDTGLVTNECVSVGPFEHEIVRTYDALGRLATLAINGTDYFVSYHWSTNGLLEGVDLSGASVRYDYTPDALDAGYSVAVADGATIERNVTRNTQLRGLIDRIENRAGTNALPSFVYAYDLLGRPVTRNEDAFGYNDRSEVVSAQFGTNGVADLYAYDSIGNRTSSRERGVESSYEANELNEYASISTIQPFNVSTNVLAYDLNGNLLTNGVWSYAYDAQNRLTDVWSNGVWILSNAYDANTRRLVKRTQNDTHYFLYDGWNIIQETVVTSAGVTNVTHFVWGNDISGSFQGAGGIGGLLAVLRDGEFFIPSYDNHGNAISLTDSSGICICESRYNAFGDVMIEAGTIVSIPFQFSTKYYDVESGLLDYGFRFYSAENGRWLNRDYIGESDGANLFAFCINNSLLNYDYLGLSWTIVRNGGTKADAYGRNTTIRELASASGMSPAHFKEWITQLDATPLPKTIDEPIRCLRVKIPNTIYAYWAGWGGFFGKYRVGWDSSIDYLRNLGFHVIEKDHWEALQEAKQWEKDLGKSTYFEALLKASAWKKELHGVYVWGHGSSTELGAQKKKDHPEPTELILSYKLMDYRHGTTITPHDKYSLFNRRGLRYPLALLLIFACDAENAIPYMGHLGTGAINVDPSAVSEDSTVNPFDPRVLLHVRYYIPPGSQGTTNPTNNNQPKNCTQ